MMETKARMRAAVFGICVNLCLFMVKLYVGISTNSISIYVDSLNNALDSVVCIIALVGFWLSVRTSPKYPFGLGRAEDLTGFITAVVIVGTGFGFGYVSLERTLYPAPVWFSVRYAVIIAVTAVVKLLLSELVPPILFRMDEKLCFHIGILSAFCPENAFFRKIRLIFFSDVWYNWANDFRFFRRKL